MTKTIAIKSADDRLIDSIRRARTRSTVEISGDKKYAVVLIQLAPAVTQGDYAVLSDAIKEISGIQGGPELLIDKLEDVPVPEGKELSLTVSCQFHVSDAQES